MPPIPRNNSPLIKFLTNQVKLDSDLIILLTEAGADTERRIARSGSVVRQQQLASVLKDIRIIQHELWVLGVGPKVVQAIPGVENAAAEVGKSLDTYLEHKLGKKAAEQLISAFENTVQRGLALDALRTPTPLSARVYNNAALSSNKIERIVRSGIIRGFSAREIAAEAKKFINPGTPGGASYAAMRLGRTELNNAFHSRQLAEAERPWVNGVKWNRSKSHPKKDICDSYAEHDEGLGVGVWAKSKVPSKPHPQCLCFMTYDVMSEEDALNLILGQVA